MKIITAVENYHYNDTDVRCFLAGGITNCNNWQDEVINCFKQYDESCKGYLDNLVLFNPRRANFPINDPTASEELIKWEFEMINSSDIFSMYFAGGISDQPICMYELGRNLYRMQSIYPKDFHRRFIVSCDSTYKRINDVRILMNLAWNKNNEETNINYGQPWLIIDSSPIDYMNAIINAYKYVKSRNGLIQSALTDIIH